MATIAQPMTGVTPRPSRLDYIWSWMTTVDHKRIGILYLTTSMAFFVIGGVEALMIRVQLARPGQHIYSAETYNSLFTMHGTTMIFLAVMPMSAAFFNFIAFLFFGLHVAQTIGTGLIAPEVVDARVIFGALMGAITWNLFTWWGAIPSSSSHALIGGLLGRFAALARRRELLREALKDRCSLGDVCAAMRDVFGDYRPRY